MINLAKLRSVVSQFIEKSLEEFTTQYSDVGVSCFGLFSQGYYGSVSAFLDTSTNAQEKLRQSDSWLANRKKDKATIELMGKTRFAHWIQIMEANGRDSMGRFNTNCNDFAYCIGELMLPNWPESHSETEGEGGRWDFLWPDGRITRADSKEGDAGIDRELFPFLLECLESTDITRLKKEGVFRLGVQMHDETFMRFWVPKPQQTDGYQAFEYCYKNLGF